MHQMTELSHTLWRQRRLLERLVYKLEVQQLVLAAGRTRWLNAAAHEVEGVMEDIRAQELARAVQVAAVGAALGLGADPLLADIMAAAPPPWDQIMAEHYNAFLAMTVEIEALSKHNRDILGRGLAATRDLIAAFDGQGREADVYTQAGTGSRLGRSRHTVERAV